MVYIFQFIFLQVNVLCNSLFKPLNLSTMKFFAIIIVLLFFSQITFGQIGVTTSHPMFSNKKEIKIASLIQVKRSNEEIVSIKAMPSAFCYKELGFFCKIELKLDKFIVTPIRFRLGSLDYTNSLEGK